MADPTIIRADDVVINRNPEVTGSTPTTTNTTIKDRRFTKWGYNWYEYCWY